MNGRWLRWKVWRGVFRVLPLARRYSFPLAGAAATDTAQQILDDTTVLVSGAFTPEQMHQVVVPAQINDKIRVRRAPAGSSHFERQIAIVPNCAVLGHVNAVIRTSDGAMLQARAGRPPNWNFAKPQKLRSRAMGDGLVTSMEGTRHYYHFFERLLPLLGYLEREHTPGEALTILVPAKGPPFQHSVCQAVEAAYPGVTFLDLGPDERAEVPRYLWLHEAADNTEWLPVTAESAARLGAVVRSQYGQSPPRGGELMFFTRGNAKQRQLLNAAPLEAIAASRGFARFTAVSSNHADQVQRFGNADVIVAVHGAGLTNLLFARPGTTVIELFPENCVKSTYLWLSNRLNIRHHALLGSSGDYHQAFHVDPDRFAARLDKILALSPQHAFSSATAQAST